MNQFFRILAFLILSHSGFEVLSQEYIEEAQIQLILPNDNWQLISKDDKNNLQVYYYKRNPILDSANRKVIANISVVVEDVPSDTDVVSFSVVKRGSAPFEVLDMFNYENGPLQIKNAIGWKGRYRDKVGEHTVYVIHAINNQKGLQIICDVTSELFEMIDAEFKATLKSIIADK